MHMHIGCINGSHTLHLSAWYICRCCIHLYSIVRKNWCHSAYLLTLGAISTTRAKCDQNNVKQLKQAVQVCEVKGIAQKEIQSKFKWQ